MNACFVPNYRFALDRQVDPKDVPVAQAGLLRTDYTPGDIGFDPLGLKPTNPADLKNMQTKELQSKCYTKIDFNRRYAPM